MYIAIIYACEPKTDTVTQSYMSFFQNKQEAEKWVKEQIQTGRFGDNYVITKL